MIDLLNYYRFKNTPLSFSKFKDLLPKHQEKIIANLEKEKANLLIEIVAFCLMPNHFHLLLKQVEKNGIITSLGNLQNSYAKYFNLKYHRIGPVFQSRFKSVLIKNDPQLLHISRYIHLNPYSSKIIKKKQKLISYPWSSLPQYLGIATGFCNPQIILDQFKNPYEYQKFVFARADYQKRLDEIKHLYLE